MLVQWLNPVDLPTFTVYRSTPPSGLTTLMTFYDILLNLRCISDSVFSSA
uniref:Uncharacterized protein n=1 Tax=Anguilla anguilla TaxID=7936 RepID=A0A0E9RKF9_ANGAN